jgi:uncharacterized protein (TIGR02145 family)
MKKLFISFLSITFLLGCSTNNGVTTVVPAAPTNLTGAAISATQINLSWTYNATNENGYKVQRKTAGGSFTDVGSTGTDISTFSDLGLTNNTAYTYRVYAYNAAGNSLQYSNEITITTSTNGGGGGGSSVTDIDGNIYPTVLICNQRWTAKNLDVSHYRNGDVIPQVTDPTQWSNLTTGAWCYYNNSTANGIIYGKLYNWYAVNDPRGLAPIGYHVSTDAELTSLETCLGGSSVAGGTMKEIGTTHWLSPNTGATNSSGFTGLPGADRDGNGTFSDLGGLGDWWSSTEYSTSGAWTRYLYYVNSDVSRSYFDKTGGCSVRCIKD